MSKCKYCRTHEGVNLGAYIYEGKEPVAIEMQVAGRKIHLTPAIFAKYFYRREIKSFQVDCGDYIDK